MSSYRIEEFTGPSGLKRVDSAPQKPGPNDVVIRLRASSLNFRDGMIINGFFGNWVQPGIVPLSDGAGDVVEVGEKVTRCKVGDRVMPIFNPRWIGGKRPRTSMLGLGGDTDGTLRDFITANEEAITPIPEHLSYEEAASLPGEESYGSRVSAALLVGLSGLPEGQRDVVVLKLFRGLAFTEIASRLGISEEACRMRLSRGLAGLRDHLEAEGVEP